MAQEDTQGDDQGGRDQGGPRPLVIPSSLFRSRELAQIVKASAPEKAAKLWRAAIAGYRAGDVEAIAFAEAALSDAVEDLRAPSRDELEQDNEHEVQVASFGY